MKAFYIFYKIAKENELLLKDEKKHFIIKISIANILNSEKYSNKYTILS